MRTSTSAMALLTSCSEVASILILFDMGLGGGAGLVFSVG